MDPKQNQEPQKERSSGGIGQGIDFINSWARRGRGFSNPLNKVGSTLAQQTVKKGILAFLGTSMPVAIALIVVLVFTFIMVTVLMGGVVGTPPIDTRSQTTNPSPTIEISPTILPTQTSTPTPAVP
ncbi:MAG: hypothetical protein HY424_01250 [Candidatus Levybacteria bacterium]|nr:hypothetical protein [Candidatus Levybacteria bacterium]